MKKSLALVVVFTMMLSMVLSNMPAATAYADDLGPNGSITRRALVIGNTHYAQSALEAPAYDAIHMQQLFKQMSFSGTTGGAAEEGPMLDKNITKQADRTSGQILADIAAAFAGADDDDVSYFYYSGHGSVLNGEAQLVGVDMNYVSLEELKSALDKVHGTKIILLDSCFSGGFINQSNAKSAVAAASAASVSAFSASHNKPFVKSAALHQNALAKMKSTNAEVLFPYAFRHAPPQKEKPISEQFNGSVTGIFSKTSKFIDSGKYIVLTAAAMNQYSFEFPFNVLYGSSFIMNGIDYAEKGSACSGEFTGMLVAGAGIVTLSTAYGQTGLLADFNGDRKLTAAEMEYYLQGAVTCSNVQLYPSDESAADTVIFSHDAGVALDNATRVSLADGTGPITSDVDTTNVRIQVNPPAGYENKLVVYKFPKSTDGEGANGYIDQVAVKTFSHVGAGIQTWDGRDDDKKPVSDGIYTVMLECGADLVQPGDPPTVYPGVTIVMERGQSDFTDEVSFKANGQTWAIDSADGTKAVNIATDGTEDGVWFTAPATGAMNIYADASKLDENLTVTCTQYDGLGNAVNYSQGKGGSTLFLPFAVEQGKKYFLKFGFGDDPEKDGDVGSYTYTMKLNNVSPLNKDIHVSSINPEARLIKPAANLTGDYIIQSTGTDDTAAILLDSNQITLVAISDDFNDGNFLMRTPLVVDHSYLLFVASRDATPDYTFSVIDPDTAANESTPKFDTTGIETLSGSDMGVTLTAANDNGDTTYRLITTGDDAEKWTIYTSQSNAGVKISKENDPYIMLMDKNYHLISSNDDYNQDYNSAFSAVLEPNETYILACRNSYKSGYDFAVSAISTIQPEDDSIVSKPTAVFTDNSGLSLDAYGNISAWGYNRFGELGLGTEYPSPVPQTVILPDLDQGAAIWAGDSMVFAKLNSSGEYCFWGMPEDYNPEESMDGSDGDSGNPYDGYPGGIVPVKLDCLSELDVADIQSGMTEMALIRTYTGEIYMLDLANETLEPVILPNAAAHSVKQILASDYSYFALTYDGKLYSWGQNWTGECGVGGTSAVDAPKPVGFGTDTIKQIAAGWDHVLAVTDGGEVYAWGFNKNNELGLGDTSKKTYETKPLKVGGGIKGIEVAAVYAGANHSMCVDSDGNAYAWGSNAYGELGLGHAARTPEPEKIDYYNSAAPGSVKITSMSAGMFSVFAQDDNNNLFGYGANIDFQLGMDGMPPKVGITKLMELKAPQTVTHSTSLATVHTDKGYAFIDGKEINVFIGENDDSCYIIPEPKDSDATYMINNSSVLGITVNVPNPGSDSSESHDKITVSHPGSGEPEDITYDLIVIRFPSTNTNLRSIGLPAGATITPAVSGDATNYTITMPETMANARVVPVVDGYEADYQIDNLAINTTKTYAPGIGLTQFSKLRVTAQSGDYEDYNLTIRRPFILTALSASPIYSGYSSLSPGGTNRMKINYSLTFPATVKVEVKKGTAWYTVMTRAESAAGAKSWEWDGRVRGAYLASGKYTVRVTPIYGGKACTAKLLTVKVLSRPSVSIPTLTPASFKANGTSRLTFSARWSVLTNVKVEIVDAGGALVYSVFSGVNLAPATKTLYWYGKNAQGTLVKAGTYKVKVTCGGAAAVYKAFTVKR